MKKPSFRIAFREEGENVNAYLAQPHTMDDAIYLASVRKVALEKTPGAFEDLQALLRKICDRMCLDLGLTVGEWSSRVAPEHERTGQA